MRQLAGSGAKVLFTALPPSIAEPLTKSLSSVGISESSADFCVHSEGVLKILEKENIPLNRVCLLDPKAEKPLSPEDGNGQFSCFLFGVC